MSVLSPAGLDSLLGVGPSPAPPPTPATVPAVAPLPLTRRRLAAACEALAHEAIVSATEAEGGRVRRSDWPALLELVAEARQALAEFRR